MKIRFLILTVLVVAFNTVVYGHGSHRHFSDDESHSNNGKYENITIEGEKAYYQEVLLNGSFLLNDRQYKELDKITHYYQYSKQFAEGIDCNKDENISAMYLRKAELALLDIADNAVNLKTFDFTRSRIYADSEQLALAGAYPYIFFKIVTGDDVAQFRVKEVNLREVIEPQAVELDVVDSGITFILVKFEEVPSEQFSQRFNFTKDSDKTQIFTAAVSFERPDSGQLSVKVVDQSGRNVAAMVRLKSLDSGKLLAPPNFIDYSDTMWMMVPQSLNYKYGTFYCYTLDDFTGPFWVTPKPFEMAVPAGKWLLEVYRGIEITAHREEIEINPGGHTERTVCLKRWVNMAEKGWYSGDDHIHSRMENSEDAEKLMFLAKAADIHLLNILEMGNHERTWFSQRGFGKDFRVADDGYFLVPGQEDPRSQMGHAIGINIRSLARNTEKYLLNDLVADEIHKQGGLYGHTHVGEKAFAIFRDMTMLIPRGKSDFNSILQIHLGTEYYYDFLNLGYKLTASAGSDAPYGGMTGLVRVYAYTGKDKFEPDDWFDAMKKGNTFVSCGPMLEFTVNGQIPGSEIVVDGNEPLTINAKAWGQKGVSAPKLLEVIKLGEPIKQTSSTDPAVKSLDIEMALDSEYGFWIALHAVGHNGSEAHTTPIYVSRKGFRHWDIEKAEALIDSRLEILDGIEKMVSEAETRMIKGDIEPIDYWSALPALNGEQLRERLNIIRSLMFDLQEKLKDEEEIRNINR
ncbi:MAG: CehA/McbA family metallohydrolase [Sedimentisphaeraceae bacterium JB056]